MGCPNNYQGENALTGTPTNTSGPWLDGDFETNGILESTQIITNGLNIDYDSGTLVELNNGFCVNVGANFAAVIDGCDAGGGGILLQEGSEENTSK